MKLVRSEPERLDASEAKADAELKRALSALSRDRPSAESLKRVQKRLMQSLSQPRPARFELAARLRSPQLLLAAAGFLTAALLVPRLGRMSTPPSASQLHDLRVQSARAPLVESPARPKQGRLAEAAPLKPEPSLSEAEPAPVRAPAKRRHAVRASVRSAQDKSLESPSVPVATTEPAAEASATEPTRDAQPSAKPLAATAQPIAPPRADMPRTVAPPVDEVTLLRRARRSAVDEPRAALEALEQHKQRFPHGTLAPEREVLAIELLRALSRDAEAAQRAQSFQRDFPGSVYLPRVLR